MALESEEEEEWERELRKAEAIMNLNLNAPPQVGEAENNGSKEDEVVEVDTQVEPVTNPLIGVNKRAYSSRFSASSGRGGSGGQNATGRGDKGIGARSATPGRRGRGTSGNTTPAFTPRGGSKPTGRGGKGTGAAPTLGGGRGTPVFSVFAP